jgi:hypothetical protein
VLGVEVGVLDGVDAGVEVEYVLIGSEPSPCDEAPDVSVP